MPGGAVLITGGTSGIGRATAELLHEGGYRLMVTGRNPATVAEARRELPEDVVVLRADARSLRDSDRCYVTGQDIVVGGGSGLRP